ncbi:unnamed protein product [Knipowitschia caucasica]
MATKSNTNVPNISYWCRGEGLDVKHAILVVGVPEKELTETVEEELENVKVLGKVRVRGKIFDPVSQTLTMLCECREVVDSSRVPPEVVTTTEGCSWKIVTAGADTHSDLFTEKLDKFLEVEGKTLEDIQRLCSPGPSWNQSPESIIRAVGDVLQPRSNESSAYKRLRILSGVNPTPTGEENLDNWVEQAKFMSEEYEFSDKEKRRRIVESLKGPALEIIQAVRTSNPLATHTEYLKALENSFGTSESGEELYFKFRALHQRQNECLSDFLLRVERTLNKVIRKGGLQVGEAHKARLEQLIKGATESDMMLLKLNLREKRGNPPLFLDLLKEIREEEECEAARQKFKKPVRQFVRSIQTTETDGEDSQPTELQNEVQELKAKLKALNQQSKERKKGSNERKKDGLDKGDEIQQLKQEVNTLKSQIRVMSVKPKPHPKETSHYLRPKVESNHKLTHHSSNARPKSTKESDYFCYRCGEKGHIAPNCTAPENSQKVIQKLIRQVRGGAEGKTEGTKDQGECIARVNTANVSKTSSDIPEGLIGPSSTVPIKVDDISCSGLMDSGSTVTIIFEDWYKANIPHVPIQPISSLAIWGLSAESYPYSGYVVVEIEFPEDLAGVKGPITVLALVCPEPPQGHETPVVVGTNAFLFRRLFQLHKEHGSEVKVSSMRIQAVYDQIQAQPFESEAGDKPVGQVRWQGPGPLTIAPGEKYYATGKVDQKITKPQDILLVEAAAVSQLPAGVLIQPGVLSESDLDENSCTVLVHNESERPTCIQVGTVIAEMHAVDVVASPQTKSQTSLSQSF